MLALLLTSGCLRNLLTPEDGGGTSPGGCEPTSLTCTDCTFEDDLADSQGIRRVYQCALPAGDTYDVVARSADDATAAYDEHYYNAGNGKRHAAGRWYDEAVCEDGGMAIWWGADMGDCQATCEWEPERSEADPSLAACG
jgi:hypothetical protein